MQFLEVNPTHFDRLSSYDDMFETYEEARNADNFRLKKPNLKKIGKIALAVGTGGASLAASKSGRQKIGRAAKKVGSVIKEVALDTTIMAPLIPLVPMMKKGIQKKGKPVPKGVSSIAKAFYNEVVTKHGDYDEIHFDNDLDADNIVEEAASGIIKGILEFVKGIAAKKKAGQTLSPTEEVIASGTETVQTNLQKQAKDEAATTVGKNILFNRKFQIIAGLSIVAIIGIIWYMRRKH